MDESNGNGVYSDKLDNLSNVSINAPATGADRQTNNINIIMNSTSAASTLPTSVSTEDLSQSLSEYTDADETISAPTEFLAEFLSAVMLKDYKKALKYCKLILQYEPNNATATEFYPLILEKLRDNASSDSDENCNKSSSPELVLELHGSNSRSGSGSTDEGNERGLHEQQFGLDADEYDLAEEHSPGESQSNCSDGVSLSESGGSENEEVDDVADDEEDAMSSSLDDLPIDEQHSAPAGCEAANGSCNSSSGCGGRSRSDNTTHSYSSLLLEEEDDIAPINLQFPKDIITDTQLDISNGNQIPPISCSDSESPTEPLTQRLAAILRSKCGVSYANTENH